MQCPHCTAHINKTRGLSVTCGDSKCQEAEFKANQERNKPKKRIRLKPKVGAKKADGSTWVETPEPADGVIWNKIPGGLMKLEIPVPTPTSNEHMFARLLVEVVGHVKFDYALMTSLAESLGVDSISDIIDRAEAVVNRVKNARR